MSQVDFDGLHDSPLFKDLDSAEIGKLAELFTVKEIAKGKTVFIENMPGESLYLIKIGKVRVSRMLAEGDEQVLTELVPNDVFGEMAVLDGGARSATARIVEDVVLFGLTRSGFESIASKNPGLGLKLALNIIRIFSSRLRESQQDYRTMILASLKQKK